MHAIHDQYRETQSLILHIVEGLTDEQWSPQLNAKPPIAFHVWQIAREADILHALVCEATGRPAEQVWDRDQLGERWGFPDGALGLMRTGMGMNAAEAARLPWPEPHDVIAYLCKAFMNANAAIDRLEANPLQVLISPQVAAVFGGAATVERAMMRAIANGNRHLGIIGWISTSQPADRIIHDSRMRMRDPRVQPLGESAVADS